MVMQCAAPSGIADVQVEGRGGRFGGRISWGGRYSQNTGCKQPVPPRHLWADMSDRVDKAGGEGLYTCPFRGRLLRAFCGAAAALAQLDRASVYGTEGCRFESCKLRFPVSP